MKYILFICFLFISTFSVGQIIRGKITTGNGDEIPYANVYLKKTKIGTSSNDNGFYELNNVPKDRYTLIISSIGYKTKFIKIHIISDKKITRNITLLEDNSLDEIVISGTLRPVSKTNSPVPVEVYSKTFFRKNPTPSIFESLQNVNGVRPQLNCSVCNTGDIHINGLEGSYTFVLIDGMPIVSGLSTVYGLTGIPQALIERVEIVKGSASTLYGSEAVGDIINVSTKNPTNAPLLTTNIIGSS